MAGCLNLSSIKFILCVHLLVSFWRWLTDPVCLKFQKNAKASLRQLSQYLPPLLFVKAREITCQLILIFGPTFSVHTCGERIVAGFRFSLLKESSWLADLGLKA